MYDESQSQCYPNVTILFKYKILDMVRATYYTEPYKHMRSDKSFEIE